MGRSPCCSKVGLKRGPWSTKEDNLLTNYIQLHGEGQWRSLPKNAGLLRCGKSCRLRWMNYLRPGIKRGNISQDEEDLIVRLHGLLGNRWSLIAGRLPGRTDNEIKNYWNTHLLKKLNDAGIHPKPHKDLPKPTKSKKSTAAVAVAVAGEGKKKNKQKKDVHDVAIDNHNKKNGEEQIVNDNISQPKIKVYLPKAIRVSSGFSRTSSYDSLASGTSSSDGGGAAEMVAWPPLFEDVNYGGGGDEDGFMAMLCGEVHMLDQVYDEYLQLL